METQSVACRFNSKEIAMLDSVGKMLDRDRSYLIRKAVSEFVENMRWHVEETKRALKEADKGLFASDSEVAAFLNSTKKRKK